jgi:hypothetical protein
MYKVEFIVPPQLEGILNKRHEEGWEPIHIVPKENANWSIERYLVVFRKLQQRETNG